MVDLVTLLQKRSIPRPQSVGERPSHCFNFFPRYFTRTYFFVLLLVGAFVSSLAVYSGPVLQRLMDVCRVGLPFMDVEEGVSLVSHRFQFPGARYFGVLFVFGSLPWVVVLALVIVHL